MYDNSGDKQQAYQYYFDVSALQNLGIVDLILRVGLHFSVFAAETA
jgi:hypothetical protein